MNASFSIGSIALIDKINAEIGFFDFLFDGIGGRARNLKETAKLLTMNRLGDCVSIHRLTKLNPIEVFRELGFRELPKERSLYRNVERLGELSPVILEKYQKLIKRHDLVSVEQFVDFSSSYFEGKQSTLGALGYSRDHEPGKEQLVFGISTGLNNVPTALTIQKGNIVDKKHMRVMLKTVSKVLEPDSLLIFDCGANTKAIKKKIKKLGFHYLTLKPKKRGPYKQFIKRFQDNPKQVIEVNGIAYECVKVSAESEQYYVFFSEKLFNEQLAKRKKKFAKELNKNDSKLKKLKRNKPLSQHISKEGIIQAFGQLQKQLSLENPFITSLEGYFILESSLDLPSEDILRIYKNRDKAEKLIRDMKEGTELRPMRHWSKKAVIGYLLIVFLTNCLISLTQFFCKNPLVKNLKLLKKYLHNLTLTVVYPKKAFRFTVLCNETPEITAIFGDFLKNYKEKPLDFG